MTMGDPGDSLHRLVDCLCCDQLLDSEELAGQVFEIKIVLIEGVQFVQYATLHQASITTGAHLVNLMR